MGGCFVWKGTDVFCSSRERSKVLSNLEIFGKQREWGLRLQKAARYRGSAIEPDLYARSQA